MKNKILITGGAGYIGSHTLLELLLAGYECVVIDNFCNGSEEAIKRVKNIVCRDLDFAHGDVRDASFLKKLFLKHKFNAVIHLSGLKSVSESIRQPLIYYDNNVNATQVLLQAMQEAGVFKLILVPQLRFMDSLQKFPSLKIVRLGSRQVLMGVVS